MLINLNLAYAGEELYRFDDQKQLTASEISIWKYKMERIIVRSEFGRWEVVQGINTRLTDTQLLKLVNSEHVATERLKAVEAKQNLGLGVSITGLVITVLGGLFIANIFKVQNGLYYGIGGAVTGAGVFLIGNAMYPVIADEESHILNIDEARAAASKYNEQLRKTLNVPDSFKE